LGFSAVGKELGMRLTIEKVMILKTLEIFKQSSKNDLAQLAPFLKEISVKTGEKIITKGEMGNSLYIIIQGQVKVHDGDKQLAIFHEREVFGEMAVLDSEVRSADITALEETDLFQLDGESLREFIASHSNVAMDIIKILCGRLRKIKNA
jgi:CRP/FNR family transcriptional regulator, cyclic AMP receptor protein